MVWPIDDIDVSDPSWTREKILATVNKIKAILANTPRQNEYRISFEIATATGVIGSISQDNAWTVEKDAAGPNPEFTVTHNLGLSAVDKLDIQAHCSGDPETTQWYEPEVVARDTNSFRVKLHEATDNPTTQTQNEYVSILCSDYDSALNWPTDDLTTLSLDTGTDLTTNGRVELHQAALKLQGILATSFPPGDDIYGLTLVVGPKTESDWGILYRTSNAASWFTTHSDLAIFQTIVWHNLGLDAPEDLTISVSGCRTYYAAPAFSGTLNPYPLFGPYIGLSATSTNSFTIAHNQRSSQNSGRGNGVIYVMAKKKKA